MIDFLKRPLETKQTGAFLALIKVVWDEDQEKCLLYKDRCPVGMPMDPDPEISGLYKIVRKFEYTYTVFISAAEQALYPFFQLAICFLKAEETPPFLGDYSLCSRHDEQHDVFEKRGFFPIEMAATHSAMVIALVG